MTPEDMKKRTKAYAVRVVRLVESLPNSKAAFTLGNQLLRSGTSVGANYRAACRARSTADFVSKMGIVEEECDESIYWMELLTETNYIKMDRIDKLMQEGHEILYTTRARSQSEIRNPKSEIKRGRRG